MFLYNMEEIEDNIKDSKPPRDLLKRFVCDFSRKHAEAEERIGGGGENIQLSLGLSLNGRFGVDRQRIGGNGLVRSSSVSSNFVMSFSNSNDETASPALAAFPLTRTCSLPAATEDEWRKRKEIQSLRRLEAKRKRVEKMKNGRVVKEKREEVDQNSSDDNGRGSVVNNGSDGVELVKNENFLGLQGSIGSQGSGGSSGISDFESQPIRGTDRHTDARSPASVHSQPEQKAAVNPATTNGNKQSNVENGSARDAKDQKEMMVKSIMMGDMPCVTTKEEGPDGRRIEGFLYRYKKGEEVKIMCVCHGSFHSPAEFVKHGGGGDVEHPLRHIVICPTPF